MESISNFLVFCFLGMPFVIANLDPPNILIRQKTSFGLLEPVVVDPRGHFVLAGNAEQIQLLCQSSYPTRWMMVPSPHREGSTVKEWQIDKGRDVSDMSQGQMTFWSVVIMYLTNNPNRILHQSAVCYHFEDITTNINVSMSSVGSGMSDGELIENGDISRKSGERYGRNKNCSLVIHLNVEQKKVGCESLYGFRTIAPDLIKCANPDECDASAQQDMCTTPLFPNYSPVNFNSSCENCRSFGTTAGALVCEYVGGGRRNSSVQIVYFGFNQMPFFPTLNSLSETSSRLRLKVINKTAGENYYNGTRVQFQCTGVLWYFSMGFQFAIQNGQGTNLTYLGGGREMALERKFYTATIDILFPSVIGVTTVTCFGAVLNSYDWEAVTMQAEVKQSRAPSLNVTQKRPVDETSQTVLQCDATGEPLPNIVWRKNGGLLPSQQWNTTLYKNFTRSVLFVPRNPDAIEEFTCEATNLLGDKTQSTTSVKHPPYSISKGITIGIPVALVVCLVLLALGFYWKIRKNFRELDKLTEEEIREFTHGDTETRSANSPLFYPYNTEYEIPKGQIRFESKILGDGHFGRVTRGRLGAKTVAIKTIKKFVDISYLKALLSELKICCFVGKHEHIVNLIGGCTQNIQNREVYLIYEYCPNGNILKYLRKYRAQFVNHLTHDRYAPNRRSTVDYQNISVKKVSSKDLIRWAGEIAAGMEFLSDKNIVHGDLAARNILLTESLSAKVGDFGLAKQLNDYTVYVQRLECPLPLKWMAIESLRDLEFSVKSDVWSYAVTLWEIYTLGQPPYPAIPHFDCSSWKMLQEGYRMEKPLYASDEVYNVMLRCWLEDPESRPTFSMLRNVFEGYLILVTGAPSLKIY